MTRMTPESLRRVPARHYALALAALALSFACGGSGSDPAADAADDDGAPAGGAQATAALRETAMAETTVGT
jgi:hypothetical protein